MKIQPIQPQKPSKQKPVFKMRYNQRVLSHSKYSKKIIDTISLENGKTLIISKEYLENKIMNKLAYLKDKTGEWVKSKLTFYNGTGNPIFTKITKS